ncbi:MAG: hypothetical protein FWC71_10660 [Defluviitaleaceae bacterium]|nr:hypothetical protein [Defluviitaleaceae bacterium]
MIHTLMLILLGLMILLLISSIFYFVYGKYLDYLSYKKREIVIPQDELSFFLNKIKLREIENNKLSHVQVVELNSINCNGFFEMQITDITTFDVDMDSVYNEFKNYSLRDDNICLIERRT